MWTVPLQREIPEEDRWIFAPFLDIARNVGVGLSGTRGVGKTHLLRIIVLLDFLYHRVPTLVIDPVGKLTEGLLTHFALFHPDDQAELGKRLRIVDWSHHQLVLPTPSYEKTGLGTETFFEVAQKLPDVFIKMDPPLQGAGVRGANPLWRLATRGGEVLQALGYQATELSHLLENPKLWKEKIVQAKTEHPEVTEAADYFLTTYMRMTLKDKYDLTDTLQTKLTMLSDTAMKARFGASTAGISKHEVMEDGLLVIHDVSAPQPYQLRQFKLLWLLLDWIDFAMRGGTGRNRPLSIVIDEVSALLAPGPNQSSLLAADLSNFINQWSRNANVWLSMAFQEPYQLRSPSREAIMSLGTMFYGRMTDPPSARSVVERHYDYDPNDVHQTHTVYGSSAYGRGSIPIDERDEIFSWPEQIEKHRSKLHKMPRYEFLQVPVREEGDAPLDPRVISIARFNNGIHPNEEWVQEGKRRLLERHGQRVDELVAEIDARRPASVERRKPSPVESEIMLESPPSGSRPPQRRRSQPKTD